jgi:hypothetical protein
MEPVDVSGDGVFGLLAGLQCDWPDQFRLDGFEEAEEDQKTVRRTVFPTQDHRVAVSVPAPAHQDQDAAFAVTCHRSFIRQRPEPLADSCLSARVPGMERALRHPVLATRISAFRARLVLLQDANDVRLVSARRDHGLDHATFSSRHQSWSGADVHEVICRFWPELPVIDRRSLIAGHVCRNRAAAHQLSDAMTPAVARHNGKPPTW